MGRIDAPYYPWENCTPAEKLAEAKPLRWSAPIPDGTMQRLGSVVPECLG